MCEHCGDICDYSERQGTEEECRTSCSDYLTAKRCTPEQYYDEQVMNCSPCAELCEHQEARGTVEQCNNKCQGYTTKVNLGNSPENTPLPVQPENTPSHSEGHHLTSSVSLIVLLTVFAAVTLTLVAVAIYCIKTRLLAYTRAPQRDDGSVDDLDVIKYGQQEHGQPAAAETQPGEREELVVNTT
ncbi:hypothetical protein V1264_012863 [Littorina saxatilis]|uniref:Uncharacterized protein n=2 Tax=Littorina saxatilis TaxID=31220 RepID=A0AAN9BXY6_9CAEN